MQLIQMTWPEVAALPRQTPIVIPLAATEQHGLHLPVSTDSLLLGEVIRRAAERLADRVVFAPLMWLGNSHHHLDFVGGVSASPRAYLDTLLDLAENFLPHGFERIVFINGHGGNVIPGKQAVFELRQKYRERENLQLLFTSYWSLGSKPPQLNSQLQQDQLGHACEWETSMLLRIAPELVKDFATLEPVGFEIPFEPAYRGWITKERTKTGHIGDPRSATAEKGEILLRVFAADVASFLERVATWNGQAWSGG